MGAVARAQAPLGALALVERALHVPLGGFELARQRRLLARQRLLDSGDQALAAVALLRARAPAAAGDLAQLAERGAPDAPAARHGDAAEAVGQRVEVLDHPGVGQQPCGDRERGRPRR